MKYIFIPLLISITSHVFGQWNTNGTNIHNTNSGNVGIGTTSPTAKFEINQAGMGGTSGQNQALRIGAGNSSTYFGNSQIIFSYGGGGGYAHAIKSRHMGSTSVGNAIDFFLWQPTDAVNSVGSLHVMTLNGGNVGIGTTTPNARLEIFGGSYNATNLILSANYIDKFRWRLKTIDRGNAIDMDFTSSDGDDAEETILKLTRSTSGRPEFQLHNNTIVANDGNVGIGTASPNQKLTVNGTIYGKEVKVDLSVPGPDYVFEPEYNLLSLKEVESYIRQNKHLPEVPAAKEMEQNGINLSEMNMLLLRKVEELTLYVIDLKKENEAQRMQFRAQQTEIETIKTKIK
jgi:hypothetical protein